MNFKLQRAWFSNEIWKSLVYLHGIYAKEKLPLPQDSHCNNPQCSSGCESGEVTALIWFRQRENQDRGDSKELSLNDLYWILAEREVRGEEDMVTRKKHKFCLRHLCFRSP